jgi:hypothetical protein
MATIHATTMSPSKLDLLAGWMPSQPWYRGGSSPLLARAGGFRLDDPAGRVGIEVLVVADADGTVYAVPLSYRGSPLPGGDRGLVGTAQHGVLGTRWIYDATRDPVAVAQIVALARGRVTAQSQTVSDTPDLSVTVEGAVAPDGDVHVEILRVLAEAPVLPAGPGQHAVAHVVAEVRPPGATAVRCPVAVVRSSAIG